MFRGSLNETLMKLKKCFKGILRIFKEVVVISKFGECYKEDRGEL